MIDQFVLSLIAERRELAAGYATAAERLARALPDADTKWLKQHQQETIVKALAAQDRLLKEAACLKNLLEERDWWRSKYPEVAIPFPTKEKI